MFTRGKQCLMKKRWKQKLKYQKEIFFLSFFLFWTFQQSQWFSEKKTKKKTLDIKIQVDMLMLPSSGINAEHSSLSCKGAIHLLYTFKAIYKSRGAWKTHIIHYMALEKLQQFKWHHFRFLVWPHIRQGESNKRGCYAQSRCNMSQSCPPECVAQVGFCKSGMRDKIPGVTWWPRWQKDRSKGACWQDRQLLPALGSAWSTYYPFPFLSPSPFI